MLLLLLVQTKTLPKIYLICLQYCVDSDSTKLHCNTTTQHLWACSSSPSPLTGSSYLVPPYSRPAPYPQLPPSHPHRKIRVLSSISLPVSPNAALALSTKHLAQLVVEIAETGMRRMKYHTNEGRLRGTIGSRWCHSRVVCAG
jgi:hypothetical protein